LSRTGGKILLLIFCCLLVPGSSLLANDSASAPETRKDRESYSIGYQVGLSINQDGVKVNFDKLVQGLQDAINGKDPLLSQEEMKDLIVDLKTKARNAQMRKVQEEIVKNAKESEKFLAENKKKEGVKTTASGLQYIVLKAGTGVTPKLDDFVLVNYVGTFIDGTEFDNSSARGEPAKIQVDGVIKGWTEALSMMKVGAHWKLFVPPELAYGRVGYGRQIPPNKVLVFDMELLSVEKGGPASQAPVAGTSKVQPIRNMSITGEIARAEHGYIIRGEEPKMIWTVLNPNPGILDGFVQSEKIVPIQIHIVSGDNIEIRNIDGKEYK